MHAVAVYIHGLRVNAKLTQDEAAALIGATKKTIGRWEKAQNEPALTTLAAYVEKLGGDVAQAVDYLLGIKPPIASIDDPPGVIAARVRLASLPIDVVEALDPVVSQLLAARCARPHQEPE